MIRLENLSRAWPEFAIRDVSLTLDEGEYLVVVGPTGAGKTLLLELLLGIHQPDAGRIFINDREVTNLPPEKRGIGMVYQDYLLFPHLDVTRNLAFGLRYGTKNRGEARDRVDAIADLLGIRHLLHRYPYTLSGGERQRVAIGRALVTEPRVLLLDEPLSALDRGTAARLRVELKSLHSAKKLTVIHVTHDLSEARHMGGRIALVREGRLDAVGTADDLLRRPPTVFAANFFGAVNLYRGEIEARGGRMRMVAGPLIADAPDDLANGDGMQVMVHPDEVILVGVETQDRTNLLHGEVTGLIDEGSHVAVQLKVEGLPAPLTAFASRHLVRSQMLELGKSVAADVANAIHIMRS